MLVLRRRLEAQRFPNRIRLAERDPRRIEVLNETLRQQTKYFGQLTVSNIFDNAAQYGAMQAATDLIDLALLYLYTVTKLSLNYTDLARYSLPNTLGAGINTECYIEQVTEMTTMSFISQVLSTLKSANAEASLERLQRVSGARTGVFGSFDTFDCVSYPEN